MTTIQIDIESLISEVEQQPVLWDTEHPDYKDKSTKNNAWVHVLTCLVENFISQSELEQKLLGKSNRLRF